MTTKGLLDKFGPREAMDCGVVIVGGGLDGNLIQPSLTQYSATSWRCLPLKRMPMSRWNTAASWCGLRGSVDKWSGSWGNCGVGGRGRVSSVFMVFWVGGWGQPARPA